MTVKNLDLNNYEWNLKSNSGIFVEKDYQVDIVKSILQTIDNVEYLAYFQDDLVKVYDPSKPNFIPRNSKFDLYDVDLLIRECHNLGFDVLVASTYEYDELLTLEKLFNVNNGDILFDMIDVKAFKEYRHNENILEKKIHDLFLEQHINNRHSSIDLLPFEPSNPSQTYAKDVLSTREKSIMLSTIQWLGTSVGRHFLSECGYNLDEDVEKNEFYKKPKIT